MKISLEKIKSEKKISGCYNSPDIPKNAGYETQKPVEVCYDAMLDKNGVKLDLKITGTIELRCDRCIGNFVHEIALNNSAVISFEDFGEEFDIDEEARQLTALSVPMKILCDDYCKGLCPVCGIDLNKGKCSCNVKPADSRFEKLKNLKLK